MADITLRPVTGTIGAEVKGVDLASDLSADTISQILDAFHHFHVLFFRDQDLSPHGQIKFAKQLGELGTHPYVQPNPDHHEIIDIVTEPDDRVNFGGGWHTDVTFLAEPDLGSILYAVEVPDCGGDTLWANQHAAWEALSDPIKELIDPLVAVHSARRQYSDNGYSQQSKAVQTRGADQAAQIEEVHPVVRTHPVTGRKGLYVNRAFTERIKGLRRSESDAILNFLFDHAVQEPFTCRFRWEPGSLAMWDNRCVQHFAIHDYSGHRRHMRRVTLKGDRPV